MSDLSTFVSNIKNESSGELVRDSVVKAADECNRAGTNYSSLGGIPADDYLLMRELSEGIKDVREDVNNANGEVVGGGIKSDLNLMLETKENIRDAINEVSGIEDFCSKETPFFEYGNKIRKIHDGVLGESFRIKKEGTYYAEINDPPNQGWKKLNVQIGLPTVKVVNRFYDKNNQEVLLSQSVLYDEMPIGSTIKKINSGNATEYKNNNNDYIEVEDSGDGSCYIDYLQSNTSAQEEQEIPEDTISDSWEEIVQHPGIYPIGSIKKLNLTIDDEPITLIMELVYKGEDNTDSTWISKNLVFYSSKNLLEMDFAEDTAGNIVSDGCITHNLIDNNFLEYKIFKNLPSYLKTGIKEVQKSTSYCDNIYRANIDRLSKAFITIDGILDDDMYTTIFGNVPINKFYSDYKNKQCIWIPSIYELFGSQYLDDLFSSTCFNYYGQIDTNSEFKYGFIRSEKDGVTYSNFYNTNEKRKKFVINNETGFMSPFNYSTRSHFCLSYFYEVKTYRYKDIYHPRNLMVKEQLSNNGYVNLIRIPSQTYPINYKDTIFLSNNTMNNHSNEFNYSCVSPIGTLDTFNNIPHHTTRYYSDGHGVNVNYYCTPIGFCL